MRGSFVGAAYSRLLGGTSYLTGKYKLTAIILRIGIETEMVAGFPILLTKSTCCRTSMWARHQLILIIALNSKVLTSKNFAKAFNARPLHLLTRRNRSR